jgi:hypothetical protein
MALGIGLLQGPRERRFLMSEVPLKVDSRVFLILLRKSGPQFQSPQWQFSNGERPRCSFRGTSLMRNSPRLVLP